VFITKLISEVLIAIITSHTFHLVSHFPLLLAIVYSHTKICEPYNKMVIPIALYNKLLLLTILN